MSYTVKLCKDGEIVRVPPHQEGGTTIVGGSDLACMDITYNYSWFYYRFLDKDKGLRVIYGKTGEECVPMLEAAVKELGFQQYDNYWAPTPGNAGYALLILSNWARQHPTAVFCGD